VRAERATGAAAESAQEFVRSMKLHRFTQRRAIQIDKNVVGFLRRPAGVAIGAIPVVQFHEPSRHWDHAALGVFHPGVVAIGARDNV